MKDDQYPSYAPDKQGPAAAKRKAESAAFIEALRVKHGIPEHVLYPEYPDRNRHVSYLTKEES